MDNYAWLVPRDQAGLLGRGREIIDTLWKASVRLRLISADPGTGERRFDESIDDRIQKARADGNGSSAPGYELYSEDLVLNDSPERVLIPYLVNDLCCPRCKNNVTRIAYDYAWSYSATNGRNLASRVIHCFQCKLDFVSTDVQSRTTPLAWAGFYIGIYDRYSPEPLDPGFISLAESILGSCDSYYGAWT